LRSNPFFAVARIDRPAPFRHPSPSLHPDSFEKIMENNWPAGCITYRSSLYCSCEALAIHDHPEGGAIVREHWDDGELPAAHPPSGPEDGQARRPAAAGRPEPADDGPRRGPGEGYRLGQGPECPPDDDWPRPPDDDPNRVPSEWELEGPAVSLSLGDAADIDPALLAAMLGPDGLGGQSLGPQFGQDAAADALRPGPILAALTEQAVSDVATLTDDQLTGALRAARRIEARACYHQTTLVAELARRRSVELADAKARNVPRGRRPAEFPDEELAAELLITRNQAAGRIEADLELTRRLPATLAGLAAGIISSGRADTIAACTGFLSDADAALADEMLSAVAPSLRIDQLGRKAAALEMKLDPEAARIRKEHAKNTRQRVEVRRELSGNASLSGRELDTVDALASKAYIDAVAVKLRNSGLVGGTLSAIRARVMTELLQGRDPLDLIRPKRAVESRPAAGGPADPDYPCCPGDPDDPGPNDGDCPGDGPNDGDCPGYAGPNGRPSWDADEVENVRYEDPTADDPDDSTRRRPLRPGDSAPLPANINLLVPIGTILGWSAAPAVAGSLGLLDPRETRATVETASRHPRTRWCLTIVNAEGTAIAHGCARGQHPWTPPTPGTSPPGTSPPGTSAPPPDAAQALQFLDLISRLKITPEPIARGNCDHRHAEDRYTPSRKLKHLLRARTATCDAPGCNAQSVHCDLDHTLPWPDGITCQCDLGPKCRRHHRAKQAPGWHLEQPEPGLMRWTLPNGRIHTTSPTVYDV
jgi:Domain of unknown function (DUF222)